MTYRSFALAAVGAALLTGQPFLLKAGEEPVRHPWIWRSGHPHGGKVDAIANNGVIAMGLNEIEQFLSVSADGQQWRNIPFVAPERLRGPLHWTGSQWLCFGGLTSVLASPDGRTWNRLTDAPGYPFAIANHGTTHVIVGEKGMILTSPDGQSWSARTSGTLEKLASVVWTGTQFVAGGGDPSPGNTGLILTSADGDTWTPYRPAGMGRVTRLATNGIQVIAAAIPFQAPWNGFWHSTDGISWTRANEFSDYLWRFDGPQIVHTGNEWITVLADFSTTSWYSDSVPTHRLAGGAEWLYAGHSKAQFSLTQFGTATLAGGIEGFSRLIPGKGQTLRWVPASRLSSGPLTSVVWTGHHLVAAGADNFGLVLVSTDGIQWTKTSSDYQFSDSIILDMVWTGQRIYAAGYRDGSPAAWWSPDGVAWGWVNTDIPHGAIIGVAWNGRTVAMINGSGDVVYSESGTHWQTVHISNPLGTATEFTPTTDIGWNGSLWVVSGEEGAYTSPDLVSWTLSNQSGQSSARYKKVIVLGDKAWLPGNSGTAVITGSDPTGEFISGWSPSDMASNGSEVAVVFSYDGDTNISGRGAAVTQPAAMLTSETGVQQVSFPLNSVCWTGRQFVAVGKGGAILTSGPPGAPRFLPAGDGQVSLRWERFSNFDEYTVETSSDLSTWAPAGPPVIGAEQWTGPADGKDARQFFRVSGR